jgi:hypothetical protein
MKKEYCTTSGEYRRYEVGTIRADDPIKPDGDGWRMVTMAAADGMLFWGWERDVDDTRSTA